MKKLNRACWMIVILFFVVALSERFVHPIEAQVVVNSGEPVQIGASEGTTCHYRGTSFTVGPGPQFVTAQGNPGSSSTVSCDDGTSVTIQIRGGNPPPPPATSDGTPSIPSSPVPVICGEGPPPLFGCQVALFENPVTVYNCSVVNGINIRPTASTTVEPNGSVLVEGSITVVGSVSTNDTENPTWFIIDDTHYVAASLFDYAPCPNEQVILDECPELQATAEGLNNTLLRESGLEGELLCEFVRSIIERVTLPGLLTATAQDNLANCENNPNFTAAMISFIDMLEDIREISVDAHLAIREQLERAGEGVCEFVIHLMQDQTLPNIAADNLEHADSENSLTRYMLVAVTLSCEPFMAAELLNSVITAMQGAVSIDLHDITESSQNELCNIVTNLSVLGGSPYIAGTSEERLYNALVNAGLCDFAPESALAAMVNVASVSLDAARLAEDIVDNGNLELCDLLVGGGEFTDIGEYVVDVFSYDVDIEDIAVILQVVHEGCVDKTDADIAQLILLFIRHWKSLTPEEQTTILSAEDPCNAISVFLLNGTTTRSNPSNNGTRRYDAAVRNTDVSGVIDPTDNPPVSLPTNPQNNFESPPGSLAIALAQNRNDGSTGLWLVEDGRWNRVTIIEDNDIEVIMFNRAGTRLVYAVSTQNGFAIYQSDLSLDIKPAVLVDADVAPLVIYPSRIVFNANDTHMLVTLRDEDGKTYIYQYRLDNDFIAILDQGNRITPDTANLTAARHPDYSSDGNWMVLQGVDTNGINNIYFGSANPFVGSDANPHNLRVLPAPQCTSPIFNSVLVSVLMLCPDTSGNLTVFERDLRTGFGPINLAGIQGSITGFSSGPLEDFLTVFTDTDGDLNSDSAYFISIDENGERAPITINSISPGEEWRLTQIYWAQADDLFIDHKLSESE